MKSEKSLHRFSEFTDNIHKNSCEVFEVGSPILFFAFFFSNARLPENSGIIGLLGAAQQ